MGIVVTPAPALQQRAELPTGALHSSTGFA